MQTESIPVFHPFKVVLTSGTRERHYLLNATSKTDAQETVKDFLLSDKRGKFLIQFRQT